MTRRAATAASLVALLALTGCGGSSPTVPGHLSDAPPNEVSGLQIPDGRVDEAVAEIDGLADELMRDSAIPGMAVAVVHGGKTLYARGFGVRDVHTGAHVDADTVFQLASVSKSLGATVVANQVDAGRIGWDTPADHAVGHVKVGDHYEPRYRRDPDAQSPAGGVSSSVHDMARWLAMVLAGGSYAGRQIASAPALLPTVTPQVISAPAPAPTARASYYGHGFNVSVTSSGRTQYGHSGAFGLGAATAFTVLPAEDVGIVVLTNAAPVGVPETLAADFIDLVQYGEIREDWAGLYRKVFTEMGQPDGTLVGKPQPAEPAPAKPLGAYTGVYSNAYWGPARITERAGHLELVLGPGGQTFELTHWDGDTFTFALRNENAEPGTVSRATFAGNALTLEYYDDDKLGTFTR